MNEALGKEQVVHVLGVNVGNIPLISQNLDRGGKTGDVQHSAAHWLWLGSNKMSSLLEDFLFVQLFQTVTHVETRSDFDRLEKKNQTKNLFACYRVI